MGTVSHNVTTEEDFEGTPSGTFTNDGGAGPGAAASAGLQYEESQAAARRIQSTATNAGFTYTLPATPGPVDFTAAGTTIWWAKTFTALAAEITASGSRLNVGDTTANLYSYQVGDDGTMGAGKFQYAPKGGYILLPVEVRLNAWRNLPDRGTPDLTIADVFGIQHNVTATTGAGVSQALDAIHTSDDGLYLTGSASVFQDFLAADEGAGITGTERVGMWTSQDGVFFVYGPQVIGRTDTGTVTSTQFTSTLETIVFPGGFVGTGFNELEFDVGNASTTVALTNLTILGQGRQRKKVYFDTELDVNATADDIDITAHGLEDGDQVAYSAEGGTEDIGPDATTGEADNATTSGRGTGANWYVIEGATANVLHLSATADDAYSAAPTNEALTPSTAGNGERHSLTRGPITVPNITFTWTSGAATATITNCTFVNFDTFTGRQVVSVSGGTFVNGRIWTLNDMEVDGATFITPNVQYGEAFMTGTPTHYDAVTRGVKNCSFTSGGQGHAIEITGTAAAIAYNGNTHTGYSNWDEDNTGGRSFNTFSDVTGGATDTITFTGHGISTGEAVFYSDEGEATPDAIGLTDDAMYFVRAVDANTLAFYLTERAATDDANRINLTAGSSPGQTHKIYSANAAVFNNTGGAVTLNIGSPGDGPSVRNSSGSTTTVNNTVTVAFTVVDESGAFIQNAQVWVAEGTDFDNPGTVLHNALTNASGFTSFSYDYSTDQAILYKIRKSSTGSTRYFDRRATGTIEATGFSARVTLVEDTIALP